MFKGIIKENICYGCEVSEDEIEEVVKIVYVYMFISFFLEGYEL